MDTNSRPVVVKRMPARVDARTAREFLRDVQPFLTIDRPQLVFDLSQVVRLDAAGVEMLLHCMSQSHRRDGDLKLASLSAQSAVVLDLIRTGRLFEIYNSSTDPIRRLSSFRPHALRLPLRSPPPPPTAT